MKLKDTIKYSPIARKAAVMLKKQQKDSRDYQTWIKKNEPGLFKDAEKILDGQDQPMISVIVPCYNTPKKYLDPLVESLLNQKYENWELCLADGSDDQNAKNYIKQASRLSDKIIYIDVGKNLGIVGNSNKAIETAKGEFLAFLDHDDVLSVYALREVAAALIRNPILDLVYSDEDKLSEDGSKRLLPFFKPDWSPDLLLGVNYITHLVVARKTIVDKIGGLRLGFDGAQDYDFLLRITEQTNKIGHIPKILYHWRLADGSTSKNVSEKNYADTAGQRALRDAVKRRGIKADVIEIPERPTNYRLKYTLPTDQPLVSILIPFKDKPDLLKQCVSSILEKTTYKDYELILISNNSTEKETHEYLDDLRKDTRCKVFIWDNPFNYSAINNYGSKKAKGKYLVLLNNDTEIITPTWLEELIGVASQEGVGAVGPLLYYPDKTIQHAGIILGMASMAGHVFRGRKPSDWTDFGMPAWPRNYLAVTGACLAVEKKKYEQVGGLDETFTVAGNDVAFGIRLAEAGYRNIYWPFAELIHYENVSVGSYNTGIKLDYEHSLVYYRPYINTGDPYFNGNLDLMNEQVGVGVMANPTKRVIQVYKNHGIKGLRYKAKHKLHRKLSKVTRLLNRKKVLTSKELEEEYSLVSNPIFQITQADIVKSKKQINSQKIVEIKTANWFVPNFDHLSFGGIYTIFRFIEKFSKEGVANKIIIYDNPAFDVSKLREEIETKFPKLVNYEVIIFDPGQHDLNDLPACEVAICTFWVSAYLLLKFNKTKRKYYFIQDYEPLFYPGGSTSALAESTYRFGFRGLVNTPGLLAAVNKRHGLEGISFIPAVDQTTYRPLTNKKPDVKVRIFFYARPNNPRNAFGLGINTIKLLQKTYGNKIEIVTAGAVWNEAEYGLKGKIKNLGLLNSNSEVADLYRICDIGFVYMLSKHPSYQPFEFMASGMATVTNRNEDNLWLLQDGKNCLLAEPSPAAMAEAVGRLVEDSELRESIAKNGHDTLGYTWDQQTEMIWKDIKDN
jgi:GT2 family glycosyltransferase